MTLDEIDRRLRRLRADAERIGDDLLEVEVDPNRRLLDESQLEGESARRWAATSAALLQLWEWHGLLTACLERAVKLRGTRGRLRPGSLAELGELIEGASIECSSWLVPVAERHPPGGLRVTVRSRPDELVERVSAELNEAKAVLAQIENAWDACMPRLRRAGAMVSEASELCQKVGEQEPPELDLARQRLKRLGEALAKDPLSVTPAELDALETSATALRDDLGALAQLKDEIGGLLMGARELLEELRRAQRDGEAAHADVLVKIEAPTVPEPVGHTRIEEELEQVVELSEAGAWRQTRDALGQWSTRASSLLEQARTIASDNRAPIEARNQLRGRLEAYQAKAKQLGLIEDLELSDVYERAHAALYTAPTDLRHAEALLRRYQQALPGNPAAPELLM